MAGSFIKKYKLVQQTPLIHFQAGQQGATLRASGVKPVLDRFIVARLKELNHEIPDAWFICNANQQEKDERTALNYKMQIRQIGKSKFPVNPDDSISVHPLDLSNLGEKCKQKHTRIVFSDNLELRIICFITELAKELDDWLPAFFAVTNFGKRQSKGYGSFYCLKEDEKNPSAEKILKLVELSYPSFIYVEYKTGATSNDVLNDTCILYAFMKSGINFKQDYYKGAIFQYSAQKLNISNEKVEYKTVLLQHNKSKCKNLKNIKKEVSSNDPYFVRAVLGLNYSFVYNNACKKCPTNSDNKKDTECCSQYAQSCPHRNRYIAVESTEINENKKPKYARFRSAVTFKYMYGLLFILPEDCTPILNKKFTFTRYFQHNRKKGEPDENIKPYKMEIETPKDFNMTDFLFWFADYYNDIILNKKPKSYNINQKKEYQDRDRNGNMKYDYNGEKHYASTTVNRIGKITKHQRKELSSND